MNIQLIIAVILIAGAVLFLLTRIYKTLSRKGKNDDCPNCGMDGSNVIKKNSA